MVREGLELKNRFQYCLQNKPVIGCVMKYNEVKRSDYYKNIVFVEGCSDKKFYIHTSIGKLSVKSYYIYASQDDDVVGKEAVVESFKTINTNNSLVNDIKKCIFIVDQDWDVMPDGIYITKWHSMENYFLQEDNLGKLFDAIGKSADYSAFLNEYKRFSHETTDYWALKATVSYASKQGIRCNYRKRHNFEDVFCFEMDASNSIKYDKRMMNEEIADMRNAISGTKALITFYNALSKKIKNSINFVRGHEAFRFLQCYFNGRYNINIDLYSNEKMLEKCINRFNVELISKDGVLS